MSGDLSIQGQGPTSNAVMTQEVPKPTPPRNPYLTARVFLTTAAVVCAIALIATFIFMVYIVTNYVDSQGFTTDWAHKSFVACVLGMMTFPLGLVFAIRSLNEGVGQ